MQENTLRTFIAWVAIVACAACSSVRGDVGAFDPNIVIPNVVISDGMKWIDGRYLPIEGRAFEGTEHYYDRLPTNVTEGVNSAVRTKKHHTAGMQFRFSTDSTRLVFKWTPYNSSLSTDNMAATGVSGIDVYRFDASSGCWRYVNTGRISSASGATLSLDWTPGTPCLVNLPLFNGISEFTLGIDTEASVYRLPPHRGGSVKPVVFYGSAITQGLGASRPGLSFVNIVGRMLDVPVVNLGFSGGCLMELEMSEHLAAIDASCYVLDGVRGMDATTDCESFISHLRARRPDVPIIMAETIPDDDDEGPVDGDIADDYGMMALAEAYCRTLKRTLWRDLAWVDDSADTVSLTGTWAPGIAYDAVTRKAELCGEKAFTPYTPSGGTPVTLEVTATFDTIPGEEEVPKTGTQGAVWIGTNGCFQAWTLGNVANVEMLPISNANFQSAGTKRRAATLGSGNIGTGNIGTGNIGNTGNIPMWVDVAAEGVTPQIGVEYTFRFTFDYKEGTYGVEVKTGLTGFTRLRGKENPVQEFFPLAATGTAVSEVLFSGSGFLTSIVGEYVVFEGFMAYDEVLLKDNASVILGAARAAWLNSCAAGKTVVSNAVAGLSADDFNKAYLLNLDVTGETSYTFSITSIDVASDKVTIGVTLTRAGKIAQKTNGVLKLYGAATVEAFTSANPVPTTIPNEDFSNGDTATAEIPLGGDRPPKFFKAKIEEGR